MPAIFQKNIDGSYSMHFAKEELEVLVLLLSNTKLGMSGRPKAASNLLCAIEDGTDADFLDDINAAVPIDVEFDEDGDFSISVN